jgi:pimeloyl-ACP methyl ester carboxylesterase
LLWAISAAAFSGAALIAGMFEFQSHLIFPTHAVARAGPLPTGAERLSRETPDGHTIVGIHIPPDTPAKQRTLVLGFGGNAWNGQDVAEYLHEIYPDVDVIAFHYRGYAPSTGSPSAEVLIADAPLVYDLAVKKLKPKQVIAVGFSIGSGIVAELATQRDLDGAILVTPFDSLKAVAQSMYPWMPIAPFFNHEIDAASALERSRTPIAIIAAARDEIVPTERTQALQGRASNLVFERTIAGAGHNDIYGRSDFHAAMREALERLKL